MNDIAELLQQPEAMLACVALTMILMMLAAIMVRISRRDGERDRQLNELKQSLDEQINGVRTHTESRLRESSDSLKQSMEQLNDGVARALVNSERGQSGRMDEYAERVNRAADAESERSRAFSEDVRQRMDELSARMEQEHADSARRIAALREDVARDTAREVNARLDAALGGLSAQLERLTGELARLSGTADELRSLRAALDERPRETMTGAQLDALLMQWLSPGRYVRHFEVGTGSGHFADFAIMLPDESGQLLYLPVDTSFPTDEYSGALDSEKQRRLGDSVTAYARRMSSELIKPGLTADFALMLISSELVSARVNELADVISSVQQSCRVIPVGPSSFWAMVRALESGMNALTIQKRSAEVEQLLEDVRNELGNFSHVMSAAKIDSALISGNAAESESFADESDARPGAADDADSSPAMPSKTPDGPGKKDAFTDREYGGDDAVKSSVRSVGGTVSPVSYSTNNTSGSRMGGTDSAVRSARGDSDLDIWG